MRAIETDLDAPSNPPVDAAIDSAEPDTEMLVQPPLATSTATDGRSARSQRTREAVVDALLALLRGGNFRPTAREIADEAGTSLRSVYVHFDDLEDLFCAAAERQGAAIALLLVPLTSAGPFRERLQKFVEQRSSVWEALGPVRIAAMLQEPFSPGLAALLARSRSMANQDLRNVFQPEIDSLPSGTGEAVVAACDSLASSQSWDHWRRYQKRSVEESQNILAAALVRMLERKSGRAS